jgi:hypothetical protein
MDKNITVGTRGWSTGLFYDLGNGQKQSTVEFNHCVGTGTLPCQILLQNLVVYSRNMYKYVLLPISNKGSIRENIYVMHPLTGIEVLFFPLAWW